MKISITTRQSLNGTYVILYVGFTAGPEERSTRLVVAVLTAEMQGREAAAVSQVVVGLVGAEQRHRPTEALPSGLMERRVTVLKENQR